jgi:DNA-binding NtrC family response regulator
VPSNLTDDSVDVSNQGAPPCALIVDDDPTFQQAMQDLVRTEGFAVEAATSLAEARDLVAKRSPDVVLVDLSLPDGSGLDMLRDSDGRPAMAVVVITGNATVGSAVEALRVGATDYLTKPVDIPRLRAVLVNVARRRELHEEITGLRTELRRLGRFGALVGSSTAMQGVYDLITRVAPTDAVVFVHGESGTGKELVAQTVHQLSSRRKKGFLALNCGAVAGQLIESELFGHERGSFTGADRTHHGYFERANSGTLLLDEISEMPTALQVKLLRVLETWTISRIGAEQELPVNVRIIAATNRDPEEAVREGKLRQDLWYRLNVFPIRLPPLRERKGDVELLAEHFLSELNRTEETNKRFTRRAIERLRLFQWPGNVRELKNLVGRAFILADTEIDADCIAQPSEAGAGGNEPSETGGWLRVRIGSSIDEVERQLILATLDAQQGNKENTAKALGISLKTLYNRLYAYKSA